MKRRRTRATAILPAAVAGALLAASCTSDGRPNNNVPPDATDTTAPPAALDHTTWTVLGTASDAAITRIESDGDKNLILWVAHGACDQLEGWSEEDASTVTVGVWVRDIETISDDPDITYGCDDEGREDPVEIKLDAALGERELVLVQNGSSVGDQRLCFASTAASTRCMELTVRINGVDHKIGTGPTANPTDIKIGSGVVTPLTIGDVTIEVTTATELENPLFWYRYSLWKPSASVWGSVSIHNLERDSSEFQAFGQLIDGREAFLIDYHDSRPEDPSVIAVPVGPWWIDIVVSGSNSTEQAARQQEFLRGLSFSEAPGDLPHLVDETGWLTGTSDFNLLAGPEGFSFSVAPNCDPASEAACVAGVGYLGPGWNAGGTIVGTVPNPMQPYFEVAYPNDLRIEITDMGALGELVSCDGFPAFDPLLLSRDLTLWQATEEIQTYTGISDWEKRLQPGIETWFVGNPSRPDAVATYVRNHDGTWDAQSVLTCQ